MLWKTEVGVDREKSQSRTAIGVVVAAQKPTGTYTNPAVAATGKPVGIDILAHWCSSDYKIIQDISNFALEVPIRLRNEPYLRDSFAVEQKDSTPLRIATMTCI